MRASTPALHRVIRLLRPCVVVAMGGALASCTVNPTNPFDPDTIPEAQAQASVTGRVRAVFVRTAAGEPAVAGPCPDVADLEAGDASGFRLVLRGVRDGDAVTALSQETNETGAFAFDPVSPGTYTLEVISEDFATPPVIEFALEIGQDRVLDDLCAINTLGPEAPAVAPLPDLLRTTDGPVDIVVVDADPACDPATGCPVAWEVTQQRDGEASTVTVVDAAAPRVPLQITGDDATPARTAIRVEVVAIDGLGNRSAPATDTVVVDDVAPPAPILAAPVVGRDRLTATWAPAPPLDGDDAPASYVVFYGLLPRGDDDATAAVRDDCAFGRPRKDASGVIVDDNGRARFALEGESPLVTSTTSQTLSGIGAGTDVVVHVAAVDAAGNAGCYSGPQVARPDQVVFQAVAGRVTDGTVAGTVRAAAIDGLIDGSLALARGSAGLAIVDGNGILHSDPTPAGDVVADGRRFVTAAGAAGVRIVPIDDLGAPVAATARTIAVGGDVVAVAARPGVVIAAARTGIAIVDLTAGTAGALVNPGTRGPIVDVASFGEVIVIGRQDGVQVVERAAPHQELGFVALSTPPLDLLVHDDAVVVALGSVGVEAFDLVGCVDGGACLRSRARRALPRVGSARSLAPFDEGVAVGVVESGDVPAILILDPRAALGIIGRTAATAAAPLLVDDGLVCVAGGIAATSCHSPIVGPLVEAERRLTTVGDVKRARQAGAHVVAFEEAGLAGEVGVVVRAPLSTMTATNQASIPGRPGDLRQIDPLGGVVLEDGRVIVVDGTARVFVVQPASDDDATLLLDLGPTLVAGLPALGDPADVDTGTFTGFVERLGSALLVSLVDSDGDAGLVHIPLVDGNGGLVAGTPATLALPTVEQTTNLVLRRGRAFLPTIPFGLVVVDVDGAAPTIDAAATIAVGAAGNADDVAFVALDGVRQTGLLVGARVDGAAGIFGLDQVGLTAPDDVGLANAMVGLHRFVVLSSNLVGAVTLLADVPGGDVALVPVLELSTASQVQDTRATVRGLLSSDSAGGVVRTVLR